ncbi:BNR-4 repeat-containing protein [Rubellicoccus peritrichatus]|uniref:BNR-4 repeat-containing protein n=1 Tax=Rubellicoccus peritrichatus TaxID=3080537 RepID=A0AAQ3QWN9_9BACT|nr:BNR-4 repeat-containing protein [Puniceicoccus sp. CR14]WOO42045.1 BNR-4 repeat-containing protein [Puniceicoccus sp. CR14]
MNLFKIHVCTGFIAMLVHANAAVTYIDAVADPSLGTVNTVATSGDPLSLWYEPNGGLSDNSDWARRTDAAFGNDGDILQARNASGGFQELTTTISGLVSGQSYRIYAFFWDSQDPTQAWTLDAGLASNALSSYTGPSSTNSITAVGELASGLVFDSAVDTFLGNDRDLYYASLGTAVAVDGEVEVFIDNSLEGNNGRRSWYDGVGYELISDSSAKVSIYVDANESNTVASGGSPSPFSTSSESTGNLWRKRTGFGFDINGNAEIYEKDTTAGVGDATPLETTISGLNPGQEYGVYVCFISVPTESWQIQAGLTSGELITFSPTSDSDRVTDLGQTSVANSNRNQYIGFIANQTAAPDGTIVVYIDDGEGTANSSRSWYEGVGVGAPFDLPEPPPLPGGAIEVAPDGAWTWFNDERAIFHQGYLYSGYVRRDGHVGLTRYDPETGISKHVQLSTAQSQERDDHNNCSITVLPDDRLLVVYSRHNSRWEFYYRTSKVPTPSTLSDWNDEKVKGLNASNTYANTYRLPGESDKIYSFHRNINFDPTISISTDNGETWGSPTHFINAGNQYQRPYPRYCTNYDDRVDLIYTDGHPLDTSCSVYHMFYQGGNFRKSDGALLSSFADLPIDHNAGERGTVVYPYTASAWGSEDGPDDWIPGGRGWTWDICYGSDGNPVCVFQVQKNDVVGSGWTGDRIYYYYARWTGTEWQRRFIAHAGHGIYNQQRDYGGGMTLDPEDPRIVYISSNAANPFDLSSITNVPVNTNRRYEIYRGFTADGGLTFEWTPVTSDSEKDNLRPIVPENHGRTRHLLWFYGDYTTYQNYDCQVLGIFDEVKEPFAAWQSAYGLDGVLASANSDFDALSDLAEYALGSNPMDGTDMALPGIIDGKYSFPHLPSRTGVESVVQASPSLASDSWEDIATIRGGGLPNTVDPEYNLEADSENPSMYSIPLPLNEQGDPLFIRIDVREL